MKTYIEILNQTKVLPVFSLQVLWVLESLPAMPLLLEGICLAGYDWQSQPEFLCVLFTLIWAPETLSHHILLFLYSRGQNFCTPGVLFSGFSYSPHHQLPRSNLPSRLSPHTSVMFFTICLITSNNKEFTSKFNCWITQNLSKFAIITHRWPSLISLYSFLFYQTNNVNVEDSGCP